MLMHSVFDDNCYSYLTYFDEYSGDGFENLTQAKCWFVFDYTLENGVLRSKDVFFDNDYIFLQMKARLLCKERLMT